ncbi:hypothetical protein PRIPAC_93109 [Pristionchus pacificus]|uniref:Uncharacterized protein n=1 Tax=Pristionchus pacificus TaxID=54126 RepID=A0A2A6CDS0_PRIPA|nr:hypothetical protein PRIPAC_93109 [Pristionchus pacificus]|eukprot:PDM76259.1 hypothetical protein PRIPAC_39863 [Pristionchus pacificus]
MKSFQFPPGLITIKEGHFIPGADLSEYVNHFRIIYSQELKVLLEGKEEAPEKDLASGLGIDSMQGLLSMDSVSPHFASYHVERRNGGWLGDH